MPFATLMYHEIREKQMFQPGQPSPIDVKQDYNDQLPSPLFVTLENFKDQMRYLYENHYHTLTLQQIIDYYYNETELPEKSVLLTFDDCYQSVKLYAYPILKNYQFHAVAFVVSGWLNDEKKSFTPEKSVCLTYMDLEEMADVFEFANHTNQFHTRTDTAVSAIMEADDCSLLDDLDQCNKNPIITAKDVFAYPFGLYSDRNVTLLKNEGYRLAFTSEPGKNNVNTNPLLLKRNVIPYFMDMNAFRDIVNEHTL